MDPIENDDQEMTVANSLVRYLTPLTFRYLTRDYHLFLFLRKMILILRWTCLNSLETSDSRNFLVCNYISKNIHPILRLIIVTSFKTKSTFNPPLNRNTSTETYCRLVEHDVESLLNDRKTQIR